MGKITIREPARDIDVVHKTDVWLWVLARAAALAAAGAGVDVTLVERLGCFGVALPEFAQRSEKQRFSSDAAKPCA